MSVNYIASVNNVLELCPQYEKAFLELRKKRPVSYEETLVFSRFLGYAKSGCYLEMDELGKKSIVQIKDAEPLLELVGKMNRAAAPIVFLCKEGIEKGNEARLMHRLATHLCEVNTALFKLSLAEGAAAIREAETEVKEAVGKICEVQLYMESLTPDQISEASRQLNKLCEQRMDLIDPKGTLREELRKSFWDAKITPYLPQILDFASGIAFGILISGLSEMTKRYGGMLPVLFSAYVMASAATSLVRVAQSKNVLSALVSGSIPAMMLYGQVISLTK